MDATTPKPHYVSTVSLETALIRQPLEQLGVGASAVIPRPRVPWPPSINLWRAVRVWMGLPTMRGI